MELVKCESKFHSFGLLLGIALVIITALGFTDTAYAGQWLLGEDNEWYYVKNDGQYANNEMLLDDVGNIYSFDNTGKMFRNAANLNLLWDSSGAWVNQCAINRDFYEQKWNEYVSNGVAGFNSRNECIEFMNYVTFYHLLNSCQISYSIYGNNEFKVNSNSNPKLQEGIGVYNSYLGTLNDIVNSHRGATDNETILNLTNYVMDITSYNVDKSFALDILQTGEGRCNSYTCLLNVLYTLAGYKSEVMYLNYRKDNGFHSINRVWYDNRWHYIDATFIDNRNHDRRYEFFDIDYNNLLSIYEILNVGAYKLD